jgi:hypothetical protein
MKYLLHELTTAFEGQDAAICVVGPGGIGLQITIVDAAEAAGVKRFIVDYFGWGPHVRDFPSSTPSRLNAVGPGSRQSHGRC